LCGARISLKVGAIAIGLALAIGIPLGVVAGYSGGVLDEVIMRITDVFLSFPPLLLAMAISTLLGPNLTNAMIAIAIAWWPWYTRLLRSEAIFGARERLRSSSQSDGRITGEDRFQACTPQLPDPGHRPVLDGFRLDHLDIGRPFLLGTGRSTAHSRMGADGQHRADVFPHQLVDGHFPRTGHLCRCFVIQSGRGRSKGDP